jgi:hypothetical protein
MAKPISERSVETGSGDVQVRVYENGYVQVLDEEGNPLFGLRQDVPDGVIQSIVRAVKDSFSFGHRCGQEAAKRQLKRWMDSEGEFK